MAGKMSATPRFPVMADVARLAKCDPSTVSLALRDDPRISAATKERVRRAAEEIGYKVHPMVAAWVARKRARRPAQRAVPLAFLTSHPPGVAWGRKEHFAQIFEGARERVADFGYRLTEFRLADYRDNPAALNRVWLTRAVQGVIIGPTLQRHSLDGIDWERFSVVTIGYALQSPAVHRVTEDHYIGMKLAFEACLARGHRRIGLAITGRHHSLRRERWLGAYLVEQHRHLTPGERVPVLERGEGANEERTEAAAAWLRLHHPEVVLADEPTLWEPLGVPALGFAIAGMEPAPGVHENNRGIGRHAADLLVALLQRNERGLPASRQTVLVEPQLRS